RARTGSRGAGCGRTRAGHGTRPRGGRSLRLSAPRRSRATVSGGPEIRSGLQADPLRGAVGEVLALPDGDALLDLVDEGRARGERLRPVGGGDDGDECDIADPEVADAVRRGDPQTRRRRDL